MRRHVLPLAACLACAAILASAASAADTFRRCQGIPRNGVLDLRSKNLPCASTRAVAQRTLDVRCFLNARTCRHTFRGRRWTCTVSSTFESVRCTTGNRRVTWRNPS